MDLDNLDEMIRNRESRIGKRKEDGTLFESEFTSNEEDELSEDDKLAQEVQMQKDKMAEKVKSKIPDCPQCSQKMTYIPEQSVVACQSCGIGMKV
jgi:hypothetical protein